jgi:tetratricopeptide (TPR) repeat protein
VTATGNQIAADKPSKPPVPETWQRWNDYGIGLFLAGGSQLKQASEAFAEVEKLGRYDGPLNLARVQRAEGDVNAATQSLARSATMDPPPPPWTFAWLSGDLARMQGDFLEAEKNYRSVLYDQTQQRRERGFDFSRDYIVRNEFGLTLMDLTELMAARGNPSRSREYLDEAKKEFETVLSLDPENTTAHANLADIYERLGDPEKSAYHRDRNLQYKPDDNAADVARPVAREKYPAANFAAEQLVIYSLHRPEAPGLGASTGAASSSTDRHPPQTDSSSSANAPSAVTQIQSPNDSGEKPSSSDPAPPTASS